MKLLFAPDSFKGTLSAEEVCRIWEEEARAAMPGATCRALPVADGGEGMVRALYGALGGELVTVTARGPLGAPVAAQYALLPDGSAAIEMAAASGLPLLRPEERDPSKTSTFGTGELILDAVGRGARRIVLGLGGSATNDGGMGVGEALGVRYYDGAGSELPSCGGAAGRVARIDPSGIPQELLDVEFLIACDVDAPLCGERGASFVFGPQKGAGEEMVRALDAGLYNLGKRTEEACGKELICRPGMGAAGGMALPLAAFFKTEIKSGLEVVLDAQGFDALAEWADCIITGEGCTDSQSAMGKVVAGIGKRAKALHKPVAVLSGAVEEDAQALSAMGVTALFAAVHCARPLEWQLAHAKENLRFAARQLFSLMAALGKVSE